MKENSSEKRKCENRKRAWGLNTVGKGEERWEGEKQMREMTAGRTA